MPSTHRLKPQEVTLTLRARVRETQDTATLVLRPPPDIHPYLAGQFLTLDPHQFLAVQPWLLYFQQLKGKKELARAYSMSSAPHEPDLAVTVKQEPYTAGVHPYPPLLSPYLVHGIEPGTEIKAVCFSGPYVLPENIEDQTDRVFHLVAGSGGIPNFSIVKDSLLRHPKLHHTFVYSNKTWEDICFRDALNALEAAHPSHLSVVHTLTRETEQTRFAANIREGRMTLELLRELIPEPARAHVYVCGPAITTHERRAALKAGTSPEPRFIERTLDFLERLGVPKAQVKREAYG